MYAAGVDGSGNGNTAAPQFNIVYDTAGPSVGITSGLSSPTSTSPIPITITFSEVVTGFAVGDIVVGNGSAGGFAGSGTTYTANITAEDPLEKVQSLRFTAAFVRVKDEDED